MNRDQAYALVQSTFTQAFERTRYTTFARNLLNHLDETKAGAWSNVKAAFSSHVDGYERVGTYTTPDDEKLDVLIVHLTDESTLERARTAIRNFVADHLKARGERDAALVAFVSPAEAQWRFSYVKMEYATVETEAGKVGVEARLTPARRFSYIVGQGESCHTAQTRFLELLQNTDTNPTLADIESAFSVEAVTKEFFAKYADLFTDINTALENLVATDTTIGKDFRTKAINNLNFSKKLMGQVVFLYFLQRKGWLGVAEGQDWGTGPRDFLRRLTNGEYGRYVNLFNDVLEPLFYENLAIDRGRLAWSKQFKCRIPFLDGGLFEPLGDYDWRKTDVLLPNRLFTNSEPVEDGATGSGVFDVFDRYNFTVNEAEPLEKEVAIDPEMLGKVFENLIEDNRRKGLGAYYTPREIVHYMCQESLISYLDTGLNTRDMSSAPGKGTQVQLFGAGQPEQVALTLSEYAEIVPRADIETFVHLGEQISHYEAVETSYRIRMPKSIEEHAQLIDDKLADITVCDPAVGSGAFPVGMMTEIVRARSALTPYFKDPHDRTPYLFKRHAIQNCLYGVDIDPGAVEIAKLRLWLSLVVDEEETKHIKPLPNLDYKILPGNSLLGVEQTLFNASLFRDLEALKPRFFEEPDLRRKKDVKKQIATLLQRLTHGTALFDFHVFFSEVFYRKGGFDVVIANPPYLKERDNKAVFNVVADSALGKLYHQGKMDYWYYFLHRALDISNPAGTVAFISSRYWISSSGSRLLIDRLRRDARFVSIVDIGDLTVFEAVAGHHMVHIYSKAPGGGDCVIRRLTNTLDDLDKPYDTPNLRILRMPSSSLFRGAQINLEPSVLTLTVDGRLEEFFLVSQGVVQNPDKVSAAAARDYGLDRGAGVFVLTDEELEHLSLTAAEKVFVKPFFDEASVQRFHLLQPAKRYLLYLTKKNCPHLRDKPQIRKHLEKYREIMNQRRETKSGSIEWFQLHWPRDPRYFESEKVVLPSMFSRPRAAYVPEPAYVGLGSNVVIAKSQGMSLKCLAGILNSQMAAAWFQTNGKHRGVGVDIGVETLRSFPIPSGHPELQTAIVTAVDQILMAKRLADVVDTAALEREIDRLVYALYGLTPEEIGLVEGTTANAGAVAQQP